MFRLAFSLNIRQNMIDVVRNYVSFLSKGVYLLLFSMFLFGEWLLRSLIARLFLLLFLNYCLWLRRAVRAGVLFLFFDGLAHLIDFERTRGIVEVVWKVVWL